MKRFRELLFKHLERELDAKEQLDFQDHLRREQTARLEKVKAEEISDLLSRQEFQFKPFFTGRLMHKIESLKEHSILFWLQRYSPKLIYGSLSFLILLLFSTYLQIESLSLDSLMGVDQLAIEDALSFLETN